MIAILDYGVGNLFSLRCSLQAIGEEAIVTADPAIIEKADKLILPGVGAFGDAAQKLRESGLDGIVRQQVEAGKDIMGICLGMQLLFEKSFEFGEHKGLGLLQGSVVAMEGRIPPKLQIPHIGWNALHLERENRLWRYLNEGDCVYFVHSFYAEGCDESLIATTDYGLPITAAVAKGNIFGCQFHPEKSGKVGLSILKAFCEGEKT